MQYGHQNQEHRHQAYKIDPGVAFIRVLNEEHGASVQAFDDEGRA